MLFDNPEDDARAREAFETLVELAENDSELFLLISVIRTFHEVKRERREELERRRNKVVTLRPTAERM